MITAFADTLTVVDNYTKAANTLIDTLISSGHPTAQFVEGRKYHKVKIDGIVRYFIDANSGSIYGAKSQVAPNFKWYFGTIYTTNLWNWSDFHGQPVNDPSVKKVKGYGKYNHYELVTPEPTNTVSR
jgi:hypothetical protein